MNLRTSFSFILPPLGAFVNRFARKKEKRRDRIDRAEPRFLTRGGGLRSAQAFMPSSHQRRATGERHIDKPRFLTRGCGFRLSLQKKYGLPRRNVSYNGKRTIPIDKSQITQIKRRDLKAHPLFKSLPWGWLSGGRRAEERSAERPHRPAMPPHRRGRHGIGDQPLQQQQTMTTARTMIQRQLLLSNRLQRQLLFMKKFPFSNCFCAVAPHTTILCNPSPFG